MFEKKGDAERRRITRREFLGVSGRLALSLPLAGLIGCSPKLEQNSFGALAIPAFTGSDEQILDGLEQAAFRYFWEQAYPTTGLIKDRTHARDTDSYFGASIAAVGFGLTALCIGDSRGYMQTKAIRERVRTTLSTMLHRAEGHEGFYFHFIHWLTGKRIWHCELSSVDTAILVCGALTARQYFREDQQIVDLATQIYNKVNWEWMLNEGTTLSMGWTPEDGFIPERWSHYSELMMMYLLGMGSPTHPISPDTWTSWVRPKHTYQGITYISSGDPVFTHQFSHGWFDFRNQHDDFADYFQNSVNATLAHKLFCLSLQGQFPDYSVDLWGFTASDSINGYVIWGGPPPTGPIDGSISPCAAAGSLPFLYDDCMRVLRTIRAYHPKAWSRYGFTDSFNPLKNWYNADVIGIDLGISMLMTENHRTGFAWNYFMQNPEARSAMQLAGFLPNP
jgi:hypothetical protein